MSTPRYFLRQNVFICQTDRSLIILDVAADKYLCTSASEFHSLGPWLSGWPEYSCDSNAPPPKVANLASALIHRGILCETPVGGKDVRPINSTAVTDSLDVSHSKVKALDAIAFVLSCIRADFMLRRCDFDQIVEAVHARQSRNRSPTDSFDLGRAATLVGAFQTLRPLYPRPYLCLFDSLALIEFLRHYSLFPKWTFGVMTDPFEAHCWVQNGHVVLNDSLERASRYTPIMSV